MEEEEKGRRVVVGAIAWIGLCEAAAVVGAGPPYIGIGTIIRLIVSGILCFYLYLRAPQARWGTFLWMGVGCLVAFASGEGSLWPAGVMNGLIALMMLSDRVDTYFKS